MRTKAELEKLLADLKKGYEKDFCQPYDALNLHNIIYELRQRRLVEFVKRRIGHLLDHDFLGFFEVYIEDLHKKVVPVEEVKEEPKAVIPVAEVSEKKTRANRKKKEI